MGLGENEEWNWRQLGETTPFSKIFDDQEVAGVITLHP